MKSLIVGVALMGLLWTGVAGAAQGEPISPRVAALRSVRANAAEAGRNAALYQWFRVNREVDRVTAAARRAEKSLAETPALAAKADALHAAVAELRRARLNRDVERIQDAAKRVADLCDALLADA